MTTQRSLIRRLAVILGIALIIALLFLLIAPLLLPQRSAGTLSHREAATEAMATIPGLTSPAFSNADTDVFITAFTTAFTKIDGLDVHTRFTPYTGQQPNPPMIVLLHGFGASVYSWRDVMTPLSELGHVLAYDRPAFGWTSRSTEGLAFDPYSDAGNRRILQRLIEHFAPPEAPVVLMGHSAGGSVAVDYALTAPAQLQALVLVAPAVGMTGNRSGALQWLTRLPQVRRIAIWLFATFTERGLGLLEISWHNPDLLTPEIVAGYTAPTRVRGWESALWQFATSPRRAPTDNDLAQLALPTLVVTGDDDRVVPTARSVSLAAQLPTAVLEVIRASGHLPQEETPEAFMEAVKQHWLWLRAED